MDAERFDRWTRGLDTVVTRRKVGAIATSALGGLGLVATTDDKCELRMRESGNALWQHGRLSVPAEQAKPAGLFEWVRATEWHQFPAMPVRHQLRRWAVL